MPSSKSTSFLFTLFFFFQLLSISQLAFAARRLTESPPDSSTLLHYHHGPLLSGDISVNLIWYGGFTPPQKAIVTDFIASLSTTTPTHPSVATWWQTIDHYFPNSHKPALRVGIQVSDPDYSLGKSLTERELVNLAAKGQHSHAVNVVLTASDVSVDGFCYSRCGTHGSHVSGSHVKRSHTNGSDISGSHVKRSHTSDISRSHISSDTFSKSVHKRQKFAYIWVGNSDTQCPGQCAWPFHQPVYGPQTEPLVAPNNDVGVDGMVINLASLLAGTATNPFGNGYYQGDAGAALEAASACPGVYGKGAYPGYAGNLLVDPSTGASYNAYGANGRKYLLPALFDPSTSSCSTLV